MTTATADEIETEFARALQRDAAPAAGAERDAAPAPPRRDPEAPHGRAPDGQAYAPYGLKADGTPRMKPAGPGRPARAEQPRTTTVAVAAPQGGSQAAGGKDYAGDLADLADTVWIMASGLKGGRLLFLPVPDARPYAAVWHAASPQQVAAWNQAAKQSPEVRKYVEKLSGEGSWSWVVGVAVATAGLLGAVTEMARAPAEVKAAAIEANDAHMQAYLKAQVEAMGLGEAA